MSNEPEMTAARMIYTGRRETKRGLGHGWVAEQDPIPEREVVFAKVKGHAIGHIYELRVQCDDDGHITSAYADPTYTGERWTGSSDLIAKWQAIQFACMRSDNLRRAENRQAKSPELNRALDPLRAVLANARNYDEMEAILSVVRSKLINDWARGRLS